MRTRVAHPAVVFQLVVWAGVALRAAAFQLPVRAPTAHHAAVFPLAVFTRGSIVLTHSTHAFQKTMSTIATLHTVMSHIVVSTIATLRTVWSYLTMRTSVVYNFTTTSIACFTVGFVDIMFAQVTQFALES